VAEAIKQVVMARCPDCGDNITMRGAIRIGQDVICPHCDAELEVIEIDPIELDWAYDDDDGSDEEEDEDW
jgi:alpha-aminoadipate carrier protein LysW